MNGCCMKKIFAVCIVALCMLGAGVLNICLFGACLPFAEKVVNASGEIAFDFEGMPHVIKVLDDEPNGIFILKENTGFPGDIFHASVGIKAGSAALGEHSSGTDFGTGEQYASKYSHWEFEAVLADSSGEWNPTNVLGVSSPINKIVTYSLPRAAAAGKYGVRATAYSGGEVAINSAGKPVVGIFVILYAENLNYLYCADDKGNSVFNTRARGNETIKTLSVKIFANSGATSGFDMDVISVGGFRAGIFTADAGLTANLNVRIENSFGAEFTERQIKPKVEIVPDGTLKIELQSNLPRGNYVIKVYRDINDQIFGTYVIQNNGVYAEGDNLMAAAAPVMLVLGVVLAVGFALMFLVPRAKAQVNQMQYNAAERKRIKKQYTRQELTAEFQGSSKRVMDQKDLENLTDIEKRKLFQKRSEEARETKGGKFLGKMAENRQKREIARDAGLTMEEFREIEEKIKKAEQAKEVSLSAFRRAVEEKTGIVTAKQEDEIQRKEQEKNRPRRPDGEPEFELLDSEKQNPTAAAASASASASADVAREKEVQKSQLGNQNEHRAEQSSQQTQTDQTADKSDQPAQPAAADQPEKKKDQLSILQRLKRLTEEG